MQDSVRSQTQQEATALLDCNNIVACQKVGVYSENLHTRQPQTEVLQKHPKCLTKNHMVILTWSFLCRGFLHMLNLDTLNENSMSNADHGIAWHATLYKKVNLLTWSTFISDL